MRIIVGAIRLYHKLGARGNATTAYLLRDEIVTSSTDMEFNRMSQSAFDRCQISVLLGELTRLYTIHLLRQAKQYYDRIADERTGRLFRLYDSIDVMSQTGERLFAYKLSEDSYATKSSLLQGFVEDLYKASSAYAKERKNAAPSMASSAKGVKSLVTTLLPVADDARVFMCTKEQLSQAIIKLALQISKFEEQRHSEQEHFHMAFYNRLHDTIRIAERNIAALLLDKKEMMENFLRDIRITSAQSVSDIYADLATLSEEINDLRKSRRVEERKLRNRIIDEYDDMVGELVLENHVIRNRFNEYRTNTVHEVMGIISETKKEELSLIAQSNEIPDHIRKSAMKSIQYEEHMAAVKEDVHELQMTLLKVRSMYNIKEQSLRSAFEKKIRKLTEDNKHAEEKLWDSYRDAEARERAIRRMLTKTSKSLLAAEAQIEAVQRQLKEEQAKNRQLTSRNDRSVSARHKPDSASGESKAVELAERLKRYEGIDIDKLLTELTEKTLLIEEMVKREREKAKEQVAVLQQIVKPKRPRFSASAIRAVSPLLNPNAAIRTDDNGDDITTLKQKMSQMAEQFSLLSAENSQLRAQLDQLGAGGAGPGEPTEAWRQSRQSTSREATGTHRVSQTGRNSAGNRPSSALGGQLPGAITQQQQQQQETSRPASSAGSSHSSTKGNNMNEHHQLGENLEPQEDQLSSRSYAEELEDQPDEMARTENFETTTEEINSLSKRMSITGHRSSQVTSARQSLSRNSRAGRESLSLVSNASGGPLSPPPSWAPSFVNTPRVSTLSQQQGQQGQHHQKTHLPASGTTPTAWSVVSPSIDGDRHGGHGSA
ncbi:hypothetical protein HDU76_008193, partial [Blyttiomyces sp. JEL0837]